MIKLFISLYLAVVIGLLSINCGSELLWLSLNDDNNQSDFQHVVKLAKGLPSLIQNKPDHINRFIQDTGLLLSVIQLEDISWLKTQEQKLLQGEIVINYNNEDQAMLYVKSPENNTVYQLQLSENKSVNNNGLKYFILTISYLFLAAFIALWTRPIWRDLLKLKQMANHITAGNLEVACTINKRSPTAVVVQTFQDMANRITRLLSEQTQLVNAVSHELRTPLSRLRFSLAVMNKENAKQVEDITQDVQEMESLIEEMLNYSRIETLEQDNSKTKVNISELLFNQVEKQQRSTNQTLKLTNTIQIDCVCNGHLIERAIQNLITNAIRYSKQVVEITSFIKDNKVVISVSDDGSGIDEQDSENIFKAFTRLDKSRNKHQGGFGLGLAIVKRIMDWHNGSCTIEKSPLGGAKFSLIFNIGDLQQITNTNTDTKA
ncbi:MAG: ATP-binding protein [Colwellia sp.]|nr:ATP-binding protein [Colwellia sp.]